MEFFRPMNFRPGNPPQAGHLSCSLFCHVSWVVMFSRDTHLLLVYTLSLSRASFHQTIQLYGHIPGGFSLVVELQGRRVACFAPACSGSRERMHRSLHAQRGRKADSIGKDSKEAMMATCHGRCHKQGLPTIAWNEIASGLHSMLYWAEM